MTHHNRERLPAIGSESSEHVPDFHSRTWRAYVRRFYERPAFTCMPDGSAAAQDRELSTPHTWRHRIPWKRHRIWPATPRGRRITRSTHLRAHDRHRMHGVRKCGAAIRPRARRACAWNATSRWRGPCSAACSINETWTAASARPRGSTSRNPPPMDGRHLYGMTKTTA